MYNAEIKGKYSYALTDTFMGFHCGNTPSCKLNQGCKLNYQLIMNRLQEGGADELHPWNTGRGYYPRRDYLLPPQGTADARLTAYIAQGRYSRSPHAPSAGSASSPSRNEAASTGMSWWRSAIRHHGAVAFAHCGKALFSIFQISRYRRRCVQPAEKGCYRTPPRIPLHKSEDKPAAG